MYPEKALKKILYRLRLKTFSTVFFAASLPVLTFSCMSFYPSFNNSDEPQMSADFVNTENAEVSGNDVKSTADESASSQTVLSFTTDVLVDETVPPYSEYVPDNYTEPLLVLHQNDAAADEQTELQPPQEIVSSAKDGTAQAVFADENEVAIEDTAPEEVLVKVKTDAPDILPAAEKTVQAPAPAVNAPADTADEAPVPIILDVYAAAGELAVFALPGEGWLFNGFADPAENAIRYNGRDLLNGNTVFSFFCYNEYSAELAFSLTDYRADTKITAVVSITAVKKLADIDSAADNKTAADDAGVSGDVTEIVPDDSGNPPDVEQTVPENPDELLEYCKVLAADGDAAEAVALIEERISDFDILELDEVYFFLADQYESVSGFRDIRKSISYYKKIVDEFPISFYWDDSRERINYLERRYIYIR